MKKETTFSSRLKKIMRDRGMKQSDLLRECASLQDETGGTLSQSSLSQYTRGERIPGPARLKLIARALHVNEYYLMGYDVDENAELEEYRRPPTSSIPGDAYESALNWLRENGWHIDQNSKNGDYRVRMTGWTYDRTITIPESEMMVKLSLLIGYSRYLMTNSLGFGSDDSITREQNN